MAEVFPSLRKRVIQPALKHMGMWSHAAENLVWGTAVQESGLRFLEQRANGPALGLWQVEPRTHEDLYKNWLSRRSQIRNKLLELASPAPSLDSQLAVNLMYSCAVARLIYYRRPEPLPSLYDIPALASYWKTHYNTLSGAGQVKDWIKNYNAASRS